ncbi:acVLRF1 family peptidyl-tRNA hydrolase [Saccharopolyspora sp. CA-218241]|uniref:acVLRF1 family peptidyl-tRNA hydrolase n=1 Tax=Saccharopolyspora sp. CA-218241 TaxID=3240027 RepID=UPI003D99F607
MSRVRELPGGGRAVEVEPERLVGWFERFAARHGGVERTALTGARVEVRAADGAAAGVAVPFGPLPTAPAEHAGLAVDALVDHLRAPRRIGLVLVRRGAHSVGVAEGGRVVRSNTDRHLVQGRSKAGGWSQQRFARRREGQGKRAVRDAADAVAAVLLPERLDAVVLGGDRAALESLRADPRLAGLLARAEPRVLDVPEPRRAVLDEAARRARAVEVEVRDPG